MRPASVFALSVPLPKMEAVQSVSKMPLFLKEDVSATPIRYSIPIPVSSAHPLRSFSITSVCPALSLASHSTKMASASKLVEMVILTPLHPLMNVMTAT